MNIRIVNNKYLNALFVFMLFSAIIHMLVLLVFFIMSGNLHVLNYFNILDMDQFVPVFFNNFIGDIVSFIFVLIFYLLIFKNNKI